MRKTKEHASRRRMNLRAPFRSLPTEGSVPMRPGRTARVGPTDPALNR